MNAAGTAGGRLMGLWWAIAPPFAALTVALSRERACAEPYRLLPGVTADPVSAWPIALLYLAAHLWIVAAYLTTIQGTRALIPGPGGIRAVWGNASLKLLFMLVILIVEYLPMTVWRSVGAAVCS